jgi:hypothetical protein
VRSWIKPIIALATTAVLSLLVVIIVWDPTPASNSREAEVLKVALQAFAAATVGAAAAYAGFVAQQIYLGRRKDEADQVEKDREDAADKLAVQRENRRRDADRRLEDRRRRDDFVRTLLDQTLSSYHAVKRIRRMMEAEVNAGDVPLLTLDVYDRYMRDLNDHQLVFELLKRRVPEVGAASTQADRPIDSAASLRRGFKDVEDYLNGIVEEYQQERHRVASESPAPLESLTNLHDFLKDTSDFRNGISNEIHGIVITLQAALLAPVEIPDVE